MRQQFDIGDIVEFTLPYNKYYEDRSGVVGLVTETKVINAHFLDAVGNPESYKWHPDEYTCLIRLLGDEESIWVRAKYLKTVSKADD